MSGLPWGWAVTHIGQLCVLVNGRAFKPSDWCDTGLPIIRIQNLNRPNATFNHFDGPVEEKFLVKNGDLLFAWSGTPGTSFGAHIWNGPNAILNQHIFNVHFDEHLIDKAFFRYAINQTLDEQIAKAHGGVGLRHVTKGKFEETAIPLPPLPEQRRIVAKIDSLSARSRRARDHLNHIPRLVEKYKQAILAAAFRGDLTREWRQVLSVPELSPIEVTIAVPYNETFSAPSSWQKLKFVDICEIVGGSQPPKSTFRYEPADDLIRLVQIRDYKSDAHVTYIPKALARRFCSKNDIMIGRYAPPIFQILRGIEGAYNVALMKAVPNARLIREDFLFWYLHHPSLRSYIEFDAERTAGQDGVNKRHLLAWPVLLPPVDEQEQITCKIERAFAWIDRLSRQAGDARKLIDHLDQAVLAKAFRGELVPQDPTDEPANALLERIKTARDPSSRGRRRDASA